MSDTPTPAAITAAVRFHMRQRAETQAELARVLGVVRSALSERLGAGTWKVRDLDALADHYGTTPPQLLALGRQLLALADGRDPGTGGLDRWHGQDSADQHGPGVGQLTVDDAGRHAQPEQRQRHAVGVDADRLVS